MTARNLVAGLTVAGASLAPAAVVSESPTADAVYQVAADAGGCHVDPHDLAAIQSMESPSAVLQPDGLVTNPDGSPVRGDLDLGYSRGPFQFNDAAGTWDAYGQGGNPDNLLDAASVTARMLCANNYGTDRRTAIRRHNGSGPSAERYADTVLERAATLELPAAGTLPAGPAANPVDGLTLRVTDRLLGRALNGWQRLGGWVTGQDPDVVQLYQTVDAEVVELTRPDVVTPPGDDQASAPVVDGVICPVVDGTVLDGWGTPRSGGRTHQGVDVAAPVGTPIVAPFDGRVTETTDVEADGGLGGLAVWVEATGGPHTGTLVYAAHNRVNLVRLGQAVRRGDQIAEVGTTGNAQGGAPHAHVQWHPHGGGPVPATPIEHACTTKENQP